jgi:hypothetical protein
MRSPNGLNGGERLAIYTETLLVVCGACHIIFEGDP